MDKITFTLDAIKKIYLNTAADLSILSTKLEEEIRTLQLRSSATVPNELLLLSKLTTVDIKKNNQRCAEIAKLQNKLSPPIHGIPKWKTVTYLKRVK